MDNSEIERKRFADYIWPTMTENFLEKLKQHDRELVKQILEDVQPSLSEAFYESLRAKYLGEK